MIELVVFDLDGTLLHSIRDLHRFMNMMLKKHNFKKVSLKKINQSIGGGARDFVINCIPEDVEDKDKFVLEYKEIIENKKTVLTRTFFGIKRVVKKLRKKGIKTAVLTNKLQSASENVINKFFKGDYFDLIIGQSDKVKEKPDPNGLLSLIKTLGTTPDKTVMIGDSQPDIKVSINAGTKHIAALWGYRTKKQLIEVGATVFAKYPCFAIKAVDKLNRS